MQKALNFTYKRQRHSAYNLQTQEFWLILFSVSHKKKKNDVLYL